MDPPRAESEGTRAGACLQTEICRLGWVAIPPPAESGVNQAGGPLLHILNVTPHLLNPWETRLGD